MIKLQIVSIEKEQYSLQNTANKQIYLFNLKFYGLENLPQVGDIIGFNKELLDKNYIEYSNFYQFGPINEVYGRKISGLKDADCIVLLSNNKKTLLKRFFG